MFDNTTTTEAGSFARPMDVAATLARTVQVVSPVRRRIIPPSLDILILNIKARPGKKEECMISAVIADRVLLIEVAQ